MVALLVALMPGLLQTISMMGMLSSSFSAALSLAAASSFGAAVALALAGASSFALAAAAIAGGKKGNLQCVNNVKVVDNI
jgi:hypothetical protein